MAEIILHEGPSVDIPASGTVAIYAKTDGSVYSQDDAGNETLLSSSGLTHAQVMNLLDFRA